MPSSAAYIPGGGACSEGEGRRIAFSTCLTVLMFVLTRKDAVTDRSTPFRPICLYHIAVGRIQRVRARAPLSASERLERAKMRTVKDDVFELPKPTKKPSSLVTAAEATLGGGTPVGADVYPTTYSVCLSNNGLRVAVVKETDNKTFKCSRGDCRR